jgi:hypothetical protein
LLLPKIHIHHQHHHYFGLVLAMALANFAAMPANTKMKPKGPATRGKGTSRSKREKRDDDVMNVRNMPAASTTADSSTPD